MYEEENLYFGDLDPDHLMHDLDSGADSYPRADSSPSTYNCSINFATAHANSDPTPDSDSGVADSDPSR
jgi:hypothetical protein